MGLDLQEGDEELANASPRERRRAAREAAQENKATPAKKATSRRTRSSGSSHSGGSDRVEAELSSRLDRVLDRIALALGARDDEELADTIKDDAAAMTQGIISLTSNMKFLRGPLIMLLNLVEPVLAFGRVTRILYGRWVDRQRRIAVERQEQERDQSPGAPTQ